jgi:FkbM family methyltransferase
MGWFSRRKKLPEKRPEATETAKLFHRLKLMGLKPTHAVDIGGNHGNWTREVLAAFPQAKVTLFEPQRGLSQHHADLAADARVELVYAGVGDFDGTAPFTFHPRDDSSSFLYDAGEAAASGMEQGDVAIRRLDSAMAESPFGAPDIVKIDAEGLDLKVLDGGPETIAKAKVVLIEAAVASPLYPNTAAVVFQRMDALGFQLFDLSDLNRTPDRGVLWLIEAVFVPKGSDLAIAAQVYE